MTKLRLFKRTETTLLGYSFSAVNAEKLLGSIFLIIKLFSYSYTKEGAELHSAASSALTASLLTALLLALLLTALLLVALLAAALSTAHNVSPLCRLV